MLLVDARRNMTEHAHVYRSNWVGRDDGGADALKVCERARVAVLCVVGVVSFRGLRVVVVVWG